MKIVVLVHWFPPINSSGARRFEAMTKYFVRKGHSVTVVTTHKSGKDGAFSEKIPDGVRILELNSWGRASPSVMGPSRFTAMYDDKPPMRRRIKRSVQDLFGQLPDPRLPFALSLVGPALDQDVKAALSDCDIVIGSCPPWTMVLAAFLVGRKFGKKVILDYRDQFSDNFEMPGSSLAKKVEHWLDRYMCRRADQIVAISPPMAEYYGRWNPRTAVIMNGFDHEAFEAGATHSVWREKPPVSPITIRYMGLVSPRCIPEGLLQALRKLKSMRPDRYSRLQFQYFGSYGLMKTHIIRHYPDLAQSFSFNEAVPFSESIGLMLTADYLLFSDTSEIAQLSSRGVLTTKLFEYIAAGRPIIADIDAGTLAGELTKSASPRHFVSTDPGAFEKLLQSDDFWTPPHSEFSPIAQNISREYAADQYLALMSNMLTKRETAVEPQVQG